jgi:hypothetical protein
MGTRPAQVRPGSTAFAVAQDGVKRLTYQTSSMKLTAKRMGGSGAFEIRTEHSDGRPAQQCSSSSDLAGMLPGLVEITAKRELTQQQAAAGFPVQVGTLVLEDQIANEPIAPFVVRASRDHSAIALVYAGTAIEADISPAMFARLEGGCAALGR